MLRRKYRKMEFYWVGNTGIRIEKDKIEDIEDKKMNGKFLELMESKGIKYTKQQMEAVFHKNGPALVLAVPGSGKTTTIIGRIGNLILNYNVNPMNILAITFSRASALDMDRRFKSLFSNEIKQEIKFSTIHSFANMVVSSYNRKFKKNLALLKSWQITYIIQEIYKDIFKEEASEEDLESYITAISYIKNKMLSEKEIKAYETELGIKKIGDLLKRYDSIKKEKNYYDYDDMLELCLLILKENNVTLEFLREKYKYILLDEGQDTSKLQFEIIRLLASPKNNIFIVADDDQSIYGFRAACPEILLDINSIFKNTKIYFMEQNFRSTKAIIEVANKIIENNKERYDKVIFTDDNNECKSVELVYLDNIINQNKFIIDNIQNSTNDIALLYRNNLSAIPIANTLYKNGIQFQINNFKANFFSHWVVKDIIQLLNLINNPSDKEALSNLYYKIKTYLNKNMISKLLNEDLKGQDVFEYLLNNFKLKEHEYDRILTLKICFEEARKKKVSTGIEDILSQTYYMEYIEKMKGKSTGHQEVIDTLIELFNDVENYSEANMAIETLKSVIEASSNNKESKVFLSTLHGSKGLEFTEVYLLNILDSVIPTKKKDSFYLDDDEIEEDRRLFYVGTTRAKKKLYMLIPGQEPSIFIDELLEKELSSNYLTTKRISNKTICYDMKQEKENEKINNAIEQYNSELINLDNFKVGVKVIHERAFTLPRGVFFPEKGVISCINGDIIEIEYKDNTKKKYSLKALLHLDVIKIISEEEYLDDTKILKTHIGIMKHNRYYRIEE